MTPGNRFVSSQVRIPLAVWEEHRRSHLTPTNHTSNNNTSHHQIKNHNITQLHITSSHINTSVNVVQHVHKNEMQQELQGRKGKTDRHFVNGLSDSGDGACGSLFCFLYARSALPLQPASFALARCGVDTVPNFNALNQFKNISFASHHP
jgi:hypothetical protein